MEIESKIHYEVKGIRFDQYGKENILVAIARGDATVSGVVSRFELIVKPIDDGQWQKVYIGWRTDSYLSPVLAEEKFLKALVNCTARLLDTINMWPGEQTEGGARLSLNERVIPEDFQDKVLISFRLKILDVPSASWNHLWDHIERRVEADPFWGVLGFEKDTVQRVLPLIKEIFPYEWVRARYKSAGHSGMADKFESGLEEGWFPAYHLARTAHGAICRDPEWNYLIEIGLALEVLQGFEGIDRLKRQLTKSPGTQHHVCLAADLHKRGLLSGLEPPTGVGAASNDLLVGKGKNLIQVEVKEFTSQNPARQLQREIAGKVKKLPKKPQTPVVFHVVLNEKGLFEKSLEDSFLEAVMKLEGSLPDKISAVVAGKRFVDSSGGRIKRDIERIVINAATIVPVDEDYLQEIFEANYREVQHPIYGIGTFFKFGNSPQEATPAIE